MQAAGQFEGVANFLIFVHLGRDDELLGADVRPFAEDTSACGQAELKSCGRDELEYLWVSPEDHLQLVGFQDAGDAIAGMN